MVRSAAKPRVSNHEGRGRSRSDSNEPENIVDEALRRGWNVQPQESPAAIPGVMQVTVSHEVPS
jgi:hypothetical protein